MSEVQVKDLRMQSLMTVCHGMRAYAFEPGQMVADFVTGVVIGEILDGIMAAIQNRLRSIFANYDAAMREAFESGNYSSLRELDVTRRSCQV